MFLSAASGWRHLSFVHSKEFSGRLAAENLEKRVQKPLPDGYREVGMEAASIPLPTFRNRRQERRVKRLLSDANRFERAAARLEAQLQADCWQVRQLRGSAEQLRQLAVAEAA
jgi:hypothetical protein